VFYKTSSKLGGKFRGHHLTCKKRRSPTFTATPPACLNTTLNLPEVPNALSMMPAAPPSVTTFRPMNCFMSVSFLNKSLPYTSDTFVPPPQLPLLLLPPVLVLPLPFFLVGSNSPVSAASAASAVVAKAAAPSLAMVPTRVLNLKVFSRGGSLGTCKIVMMM